MTMPGNTNRFRRADGGALAPVAASRSDLLRSTDAQFGSTAFRLRIETMFADFERKYRLQPGEGQILLLDIGIRL